MGVRKVPFSRELYIEQDDFREVPPPKYFRLSPGPRGAAAGRYFLTCERAVKDADGRGGRAALPLRPGHPRRLVARRPPVKATIHWVSAAHARDAEVRLYDRLFSVPDPHDADEGRDWKSYLNPDSLTVLQGCKLEPGPGRRARRSRTYQFERQGYFCVDPDSTPDRPVFNRAVPLRDSWARLSASR